MHSCCLLKKVLRDINAMQSGPRSVSWPVFAPGWMKVVPIRHQRQINSYRGWNLVAVLSWSTTAIDEWLENNSNSRTVHELAVFRWECRNRWAGKTGSRRKWREVQKVTSEMATDLFLGVLNKVMTDVNSNLYVTEHVTRATLPKRLRSVAIANVTIHCITLAVMTTKTHYVTRATLHYSNMNWNFFYNFVL